VSAQYPAKLLNVHGRGAAAMNLQKLFRAAMP
jgi:hypothetical protein